MNIHVHIVRTQWFSYEKRHWFCKGHGYLHVGPFVVLWS